MLNILMIEDDSTIAFGVKYALEQEGFNIDICKDLESSRKNIQERNIALYYWMLCFQMEMDMIFVKK